MPKNSIKICNRCHTPKPISEYFRNSYSPDGFYSLCKNCYNVGRRHYRGTKRGNDIGVAQADRYHRRYPERRRATSAVKRAVDSGILPHANTQVCKDCGKQARIYHHESYSQAHWLDVDPLCDQCHTRRI